MKTLLTYFFHLIFFSLGFLYGLDEMFNLFFFMCGFLVVMASINKSIEYQNNKDLKELKKTIIKRYKYANKNLNRI